MEFFNRLRHIKGFWRYGNARGLMSKQLYGAAASVLKNVRLPNRHKQIAMIYLANCYSRKNEKDEAIRAYSDVRE